MMMRRQREMQENGGSPGCLSLEVSSHITQRRRCSVPSQWGSLGLNALLKQDDITQTLLPFSCSGKQLWLPPVREWQWGGRRGSCREEGRGGTHKEEICFPGESQKPPCSKQLSINSRILVCRLKVNIKSLIYGSIISRDVYLMSFISQLAYNAWVTSSKVALKDLQKENKKIKKEEKKRTKKELQKQQGETETRSLWNLILMIQSPTSLLPTDENLGEIRKPDKIYLHWVQLILFWVPEAMPRCLYNMFTLCSVHDMPQNLKEPVLLDYYIYIFIAPETGSV